MKRILKSYTPRVLCICFALFMLHGNMFAQRDKVKIRPYADQKLFHFGFAVGLHAQDLILSHTGAVGPTGEVWFAEIPSYSVGFSVGVIGDRYINEYLNLRLSPTFHFGEKQFTFKEQHTGEEFKTLVKSNYLSFPLTMKFSASRLNNMRPYLLAGVYGNFEIGSKRNTAIRLNQMDYGLEFGLGCNFYLPLFKLCPELKFSFGLKDLINKDRSDLTDKSLLKFTDALSSGKARMVTLVFNFE